MKRILLLAALAMAVPAPAHASHPIMVLGDGNDSCGKWTENRAKRNDDGPDGFASFSDSAWVQGYLTATQSNLPQDFEAIRQTDPAGIDAWVDNYCQAHPLDTINSAASALEDELLAKYYTQHPEKLRKR